MNRYGYIKGNRDGSDDSFTFTRDTVSRVLHRDFDPEKATPILFALKNNRKEVKKFLRDTIIEIRDKFPGNNAEAKKALFLQALDIKITKVSLTISGRSFQFKRDDITSTMKTGLANSVYAQLKPIVEEIEAAKRAAEARNKFIEEEKAAGVEEGKKARAEEARPFIEFARDIIALLSGWNS
jgi:DNA-directed RNA polymerase beta' subunit